MSPPRVDEYRYIANDKNKSFRPLPSDSDEWPTNWTDSLLQLNFLRILATSIWDFFPTPGRADNMRTSLRQPCLSLCPKRNTPISKICSFPLPSHSLEPNSTASLLAQWLSIRSLIPPAPLIIMCMAPNLPSTRHDP